ncbi:ESPR domain-containing protein [Pseudoxanthomonas sp. UC29_72]
MNRVYRLIWNPALGAPVVVSELARARRSSARGARTRDGIATSRLAGACVAALLFLPCAGVHAQQVDPKLDELRALVDKYTLRRRCRDIGARAGPGDAPFDSVLRYDDGAG